MPLISFSSAAVLNSEDTRPTITNKAEFKKKITNEIFWEATQKLCCIDTIKKDSFAKKEREGNKNKGITCVSANRMNGWCQLVNKISMFNTISESESCAPPKIVIDDK